MIDKKVFWGYNADELKEGSKGYFANTIVELEEQVKLGCDSHVKTFERVDGGAFKPVGEPFYYNFFALLEEPKEQKSDKDLVIDALERDYGLDTDKADAFASWLIEYALVDFDCESNGERLVCLPDITEYSDSEDVARKYFDDVCSDSNDLEDYVDFTGWGDHLIEVGAVHEDWYIDTDGNPWGIN